MRIALSLALCALTGCPGPAPAPPPPRPADHDLPFPAGHAPGDGCADCHGPDPCVRCHLERPPRDHGPAFAGAAHGVAARVDAIRCGRCHTADACALCHE